MNKNLFFVFVMTQCWGILLIFNYAIYNSALAFTSSMYWDYRSISGESLGSSQVFLSIYPLLSTCVAFLIPQYTCGTSNTLLSQRNYPAFPFKSTVCLNHNFSSIQLWIFGNLRMFLSNAHPLFYPEWVSS